MIITTRKIASKHNGRISLSLLSPSLLGGVPTLSGCRDYSSNHPLWSRQVIKHYGNHHHLATKNTNYKRINNKQKIMRPLHSHSNDNNNNDPNKNTQLFERRGMLFNQMMMIPPFLSECGKVIGGLTIVVLSYLYWIQESMLYIPEMQGLPKQNAYNPPGYRNPSEYDIPHYETNYIQTQDGVKIHSWLLLQPNYKDEKVKIPTIVFFHGNAGNIGIRLPNAFQMYNQLNANILLVEYRGYGDSDTVKPTEKGLKLDAQAALQFVLHHPHLDASQTFIFGRSLGGAVAFHIAEYAQEKHINLAGLIVENTFTSVPNMVDILLPFLKPFKAIVLKINWDSKSIASKLTVPILYIVGEDDEIVPSSQSKELYKQSLKSSVYTRIFVVKGGTHNETWIQGGRKYWDKMKTFMRDASSLVAKKSSKM